MKYRDDINIGKLIQQKFEEKKITISHFAKAINTCRQNIYNIFNSKSIDTDKLIRISNVLNYPFLEEYMSQSHSNSNSNTKIVLEVELKNGEVCVKQIENDDNTKSV